MNDEKLVVNIKFEEPLSLIEVTLGLSSLASLYDEFTEKDAKAKLLIKNIKQGSIVIDLISLSTSSIVPILDQTSSNIVQFCAYILKIIYLLKENKEALIKLEDRYQGLPDPNKKQYNKIKHFLSIPKNSKDKISLNVKGDNNTIIIGGDFTGSESRSMIKKIEDKNLDNRIITYEKQLFRWIQTNHYKNKTGNKGVISDVYKKDLRVVFGNDHIKKEMTTSLDEIHWDKKYYLVDVQVQKDGDKFVQYKIINNYPDESFPIKEVN